VFNADPDNSCTNSCHVTADGRDWLAGTLSCTDCHSSGKSMDAGGENDLSASVGPDAGDHDAHMGNTVYVDGGCTDCHGHDGVLSGGVNGHVDGPTTADITTASLLTSYTAGAGNDNCTNACHTATSADMWVGATAIACADCHSSTLALDAGGESDLSASVGPDLGDHDVHMANTSYVGGGCADCHGHSGSLAAAAAPALCASIQRCRRPRDPESPRRQATASSQYSQLGFSRWKPSTARRGKKAPASHARVTAASTPSNAAASSSWFACTGTTASSRSRSGRRNKKRPVPPGRPAARA